LYTQRERRSGLLAAPTTLVVPVKHRFLFLSGEEFTRLKSGVVRAGGPGSRSAVEETGGCALTLAVRQKGKEGSP
jgi:hypothetical protein